MTRIPAPTSRLPLTPTDDSLYGLFGGTFDPIHNGHLAPVREVCRVAALAKVTYIPAKAPPHRPPPAATAEHRLEMTRIAVADEPKFEVNDIELKRAGASYTIDTLRALRRRHPRRRYTIDTRHAFRWRHLRRRYAIDTLHALHRRHPRRRYALLLGLDALLNLPDWHRWQEVQHRAHIIAMARPGWRAPRPLPDWWRAARVESADELRRAKGGKILLIEAAPVAVSATEVRRRIAAGEDLSDLLPPGVAEYIHRHHLYGG